VNKRVQDIQTSLVAISGLLQSPVISSRTRLSLETFKAELETELNYILSQQSEAAAAG
jgi:hypothetical protein